MIAIITLLSAMLSAAATSARDRAKEMLCINNLRQLGIASTVYAQNFDERLPHEDNGGTVPPSGSGWYGALAPFLECADIDKARQCPAIPIQQGWHSLKMNSLLETEDNPFYRLGSGRRESSTVYFFDGRVDNAGVRYQIKGSWNSAAIRPQGNTNLLLLDMHTEKVSGHPGLERWYDEGPVIWTP